MLLKVVWLGVTIVIAIVLVAAGVVEVAGWVPLACFAVWTLFAALLAATGMLRARPQAFPSPAARIAVKYGLPGAAERVVVALDVAQKEGRELIADIAVFDTLNSAAARGAAPACRVAGRASARNRLEPAAVSAPLRGYLAPADELTSATR
ncbi:MAG: hypothetical protein M3N47_15190 [Chloroflexota bacterium]|nr:hypothetical protein [Chloroflexota bacterium]